MVSAKKKIAVIGLGYVGLPLAAEFGRNRAVVGFDIDTDRIDDLRVGRDSTMELTESQLYAANQLVFSNDPQTLNDCQIYIVTVPTPIDSANRPDLRPLSAASSMLAAHLKPGDIVIYESTVFPGCTDEVCVPILEEGSGLTKNRDFFYGYSPERINPGDKVNTLTKIKKVTSGSTPAAAAEIDALYAEIISAGTFLASSVKVAEAAKVIENSQRDLNIAFVNELSVIFQRLGIDTNEVLEAAESKWNFMPFKPGMVGGHCIGVDPYYLTHKAEQLGYNPQVILAGRRINDNMARYAARNLVRQMLRNGIDVANSTVRVLGFTFKENCPDIRNTKVIDLIRELESWNVKVEVSDNWADPEETQSVFDIALSDPAPDNLADALVIAVGHTEYREADIGYFRGLCRGANPVVADLKALKPKVEFEDAGFTVFRL